MLESGDLAVLIPTVPSMSGAAAAVDSKSLLSVAAGSPLSRYPLPAIVDGTETQKAWGRRNFNKKGPIFSHRSSKACSSWFHLLDPGHRSVRATFTVPWPPLRQRQ